MKILKNLENYCTEKKMKIQQYLLHWEKMKDPIISIILREMKDPIIYIVLRGKK